jgi:hypothetical protein
MAKRDPNKTARNRIIASLKQELRTLLPDVLAEVGLPDELSLNAKIGSKHDDFFDLKTDVISSQEEFVSRWLEALKKSAGRGGDRYGHLWVWQQLKAQKKFRKYVVCFLKRSYLNHFEELSRNRPPVEEAEIWIGQQHANYGLLVTPRYVHGQWENDKSEIRAFPKAYWTIGHVLETGLVIPGSSTKMTFSDLEQYLVFFKETLVRNSGSKYEYQIAGHYCDFVRKHADPESVPLLIPEFRYAGVATKHLYRLDFLVINPFTLDKIGFELSPWSTHGYLSKTKGLTQAQINDLARDNFEREMTKHRDYFKKHQVFCLIFTDAALKDTKALFDDEIRPLLSPEKTQVQLSFQILDEFFHS